MKKYIVKDVLYALRMALNHIICNSLFWSMIFIVVISKNNGNTNQKIDYFSEQNQTITYVFLLLLCITFIQSFIIFFANCKYVIDFEKGLFILPRSDLEHNILEFIFLISYINLMRKKSIPFEEIEKVYMDTDHTKGKKFSKKYRKGNENIVTAFLFLFPYFAKCAFYPWWRKRIKTKYNMNVIGIFGSAHLQFSNQRKRDEVRNALHQVIRSSSTSKKEDEVGLD